MIETVLIYNGVLFLSVFLGILYDKVRSGELKIVFIFSSFSVLFLVASLRYDVGADYFSYVDIYYNLDSYHDTWGLEVGFYWLNKVLSYSGFPAQSIFILMSFISLFFVFLAGVNFNKLGLFIFLYVLVFYLNSLNAIRQETAVCICLYAVSILFKGKKTSAGMFIILASTFHYASLLLIPFLFFIRFNKLIFLLFFIALFILWNLSLIDILISSNILSGTKYESYLFNEIYNGETELGSGLGILSKYLPAFFLFFINARFFDKKHEEMRRLTLLLNSVLLLSLVISIKFYIFHRIVSLFSISLVFSVILISNSKLKLKYVYMVMLLISGLIYFEKDILSSNKYIGSNKAISPYMTIFSRGDL